MINTSDAYRAYWRRRYVEVGAPRAVTHMNEQEYAAYYAPILDVVAPDYAGLVYDVGCGAGLLCPIVHERWPLAGYVGLDICADLIAHCGLVYPPNEKRDWFIIKEPPWLPDGLADFIACHSVMTHIYPDDARTWLAVIRAHLAPGGRASISIHFNDTGGADWAGGIGHLNYRPEYFETMLADAGLRVAAQIDGPLPQGAQRYYGCEAA